jgi:hypothetical protein
MLKTDFLIIGGRGIRLNCEVPSLKKWGGGFVIEYFL